MKTPKIIRPVRLHTTIPEDVRAILDLHLYSEVEGRVPYGAYQKFLIERTKEFFSEKRTYITEAERKLFHFCLQYADWQKFSAEDKLLAEALLEKLK